MGINYKKKKILILYKVMVWTVMILEKTTINAGNSGTLARLIQGLLVKSKKRN